MKGPFKEGHTHLSRSIGIAIQGHRFRQEPTSSLIGRQAMGMYVTGKGGRGIRRGRRFCWCRRHGSAPRVLTTVSFLYGSHQPVLSCNGRPLMTLQILREARLHGPCPKVTLPCSHTPGVRSDTRAVPLGWGAGSSGMGRWLRWQGARSYYCSQFQC